MDFTWFSVQITNFKLGCYESISERFDDLKSDTCVH